MKPMINDETKKALPQTRWAKNKVEVLQLIKAVILGMVVACIFAVFSPKPSAYIIFYSIVFFVFSILRVVYLFHPNPGPSIKKIKEIGASLDQLETQQRLYIRVAILFCISILLSFIADPILAQPFAIITLAFMAYVAVLDLLRWYRIISETLPGKAFIGLAFAASSNLAYSLAGQGVSNITHVTPNGFTHTVLFMAILMIPVLMTLGGSLVFAAGFVMSSLIMIPHMFKSMPPKLKDWLFAGTLPQTAQKYWFATRLFQVVFYTSLGLISYQLGGKGLKWYESKTGSIASQLVYEFDMYPSVECKIGNGYKIASLGDAKFLVAKRENDKSITFFSPIKCDDLPTTIEPR